MKNYKIGLLVLAVLTLCLFVFTLAKSGDAKLDKKTVKSISDISNKIYDYVSDENKIPNNLSDIGAKDVPSTIKYEKLSDTKYKICVTYKTNESYRGSGITSVVTSAIYSRYSRSLDQYYNDNDKDDMEKTSYFSPAQTKGEHCSTVKPVLRPTGTSKSTGSSSLDSYYKEYCTPGGKYYETYGQYCSSLMQQ